MQKKRRPIQVEIKRKPKPKEYIAKDILDADGRTIGREYEQELIRCKDCIHHSERPYGNGYCWGRWGMYVPDNGWCFHAKREEDSE